MADPDPRVRADVAPAGAFPAGASPGASPGISLALRARALAASLPPLLIAAERVAATVAQGVHGRRRVGTGDSFWQFRPYAPGDPVARIDWRQAARSGRPAPLGWHVRETEWEAAETAVLWADASPSMHWRSAGQASNKHERAALLLLALAALLLRGGERVVLADGGAGRCPSGSSSGSSGGGDRRAAARPVAGRAGLEALAAALLDPALAGGGGLGARGPSGTFPVPALVPRHARVVLIGDFLDPLDTLEAALAGYAALPAGGVLMQIRDPAEETLPYAGRVRFDGLEGEAAFLAPRAEDLRMAYAARLAARQDRLARLCGAAGFRFVRHRTDHPAATALLALFIALAGEAG